MTARQITLMLVVVGLMVLGQVLFRCAAGRLDGDFGFTLATLGKLVTNPFMLAGVFVYGITTLVWVAVLREVGLSQSYPFVALTLVLVPLAGVLLFNEPLSGKVLMGGVFILLGVAIISTA